jgi:polyisoprenoid-binding protein YceI
MQLLTLCLSGPQPRVAVQVFSVADQVFSKKPGFAIPAQAGIQDSCDCGKRHWAPVPADARTGSSRGRRFIGSRAFCFLRGLALCLALGATPMVACAAAGEPGMRIDTAHSFAGFSVRAAWVKRIDGRFAHIEGVVRPDAQERYVLEVRVASGSVLMGRDSHEEWARSADFFDTDRHPWIEFRAAGLGSELLRAGGAIEGVLTLRGISRPVSFELLPADCAQPGLDCPVQARGEVDRSEFGMTARRVFVSDRVKLSFDIRLHPAPATRPDLG